MLKSHTFPLCPPPALSADGTRVNAMTVDVEEHFQVHALASCYKRQDWDSCESRVVDNTKRTLDLFAEHDTKATFFTLGWVAQKYPSLIRDISDAGHEIASHGMAHIRADEQSTDEFREDVQQSKKLL